jgi:hypothetical protein
MTNLILIYIGKVMLTGLLICVIVNLVNNFISTYDHMKNKYKICRTLTGKYMKVPVFPVFPFDNKILVMVSSMIFVYIFVGIIVYIWR